MACFFVGNQSKNSAKYKGNSKPFFTAVCGVFGMQHPSCGSHFPRGRNLEWFGGHWEDTTGFYGWCLLWYRHIGMDVSFQLRKTLWVICYKIFICPVFFDNSTVSSIQEEQFSILFYREIICISLYFFSQWCMLSYLFFAGLFMLFTYRIIFILIFVAKAVLLWWNRLFLHLEIMVHLQCRQPKIYRVFKYSFSSF